eukprot:6178336-Pleurochrysis_carterae.AAC.1
MNALSPQREARVCMRVDAIRADPCCGPGRGARLAGRGPAQGLQLAGRAVGALHVEIHLPRREEGVPTCDELERLRRAETVVLAGRLEECVRD